MKIFMANFSEPKISIRIIYYFDIGGKIKSLLSIFR